MPKKLKEMPKVKTEDEEREFWSENDSNEFVDRENAEPVILPNLKPTTRTISIRISSSMLDKIRLVADKRDVPLSIAYQIFSTGKD